VISRSFVVGVRIRVVLILCHPKGRWSGWILELLARGWLVVLEEERM
jgi:hypothetical protein